MWVNEMLTIWLWGTILSLVVVGYSLYRWYWVDSRDERK
jgi:hypothetical protein